MNVTASQIPFEINGTEYELKPLTDKNIMAVTNWVRGSFLRSVRLSLHDAEPADWERTMSLAMQTSLTIDWFSDAGRKAILTVGGRAKLFYESAKVPGLTYDDCLAAFYVGTKPNVKKLNEFWDCFCLVNDLTEDPEEGQTSKKN